MLVPHYLRTGAILAVAGVLGACAANSPGEPQSEGLRITPISLFIDTNEPTLIQPRRQSVSEFFRSHFDGTPQFDEEFRPVPEPGTPLDVDCVSASYLSVLVHIDGTEGSRTLLDSIRLRFRWTHSEVELEGLDYRKVRGAMNVPFLELGRLPDIVTSRYAYGFLHLDEAHERTNGVYTVSASHLGEEQFSAQYRLTNCESVVDSLLTE